MNTPAFDYQEVTLDTLPESFEADGAEEFFTYWKSCSRDGALPRWMDTFLTDMPGLVPNMTVIEVSENLTSFMIKMIGTKLIQEVRRDPTGRKLGDDKHDEPVLDRLAEAAACERGYHLFEAPLNWSDSSYKKYTALVLPVTDKSGTVSHLLGWFDGFH